MCKEPLMRAPFNGFVLANSLRIAISPGISPSAIVISLRPQSARARSATRKSRKAPAAFKLAFIESLLNVSSSGGAHGRAALGLIGKLVRFIGVLPGKLGLGAAEVPVGGGLLVDRAHEVEHLPQSIGRQI